MKLVILMYLEGDEECVEKLLADAAVPMYSRIPLEGVDPTGRGAWYGQPTPYRSRLVMTVVPSDRAREILDAVRDCRDVEDPRRPVRAFQVDVEDTALCREPQA